MCMYANNKDQKLAHFWTTCLFFSQSVLKRKKNVYYTYVL